MLPNVTAVGSAFGLGQGVSLGTECLIESAEPDSHSGLS